MDLYFCISDIIDHLRSAHDDEETHWDMLMPVSSDIPSCSGFREDSFVLNSVPRLLDLNAAEAMQELETLLGDVPLYHINLELVLDHALAERHHNKKIEEALARAFDGQILPNTLQRDTVFDDRLELELRHPMIGHLSIGELSRIYLNFLKYYTDYDDSFSFDKNIIGKYPKPFCRYYDGFISGGQGKVKARILAAFGLRQDHDPARPMENYLENGTKKAAGMNIEDPRELIWAWLEADHYQLRRCADLDRFFKLSGLPRTPGWVQLDIFSFLEKEAMKQHFAARITALDDSLSLLKDCPILGHAIKNSAKGDADENIQRLMTQTLGRENQYAGAAGKFCEQAKMRAHEAKTAGLL